MRFYSSVGLSVSVKRTRAGQRPMTDFAFIWFLSGVCLETVSHVIHLVGCLGVVLTFGSVFLLDSFHLMSIAKCPMIDVTRMPWRVVIDYLSDINCFCVNTVITQPLCWTVRLLWILLFTVVTDALLNSWSLVADNRNCDVLLLTNRQLWQLTSALEQKNTKHTCSHCCCFLEKHTRDSVYLNDKFQQVKIIKQIQWPACVWHQNSK